MYDTLQAIFIVSMVVSFVWWLIESFHSTVEEEPMETIKPITWVIEKLLGYEVYEVDVWKWKTKWLIWLFPIIYYLGVIVCAIVFVLGLVVITSPVWIFWLLITWIF